MKMSILEIGYKNIRRITDLKLSFVKEDGSIFKNSFIMMANGTGKTTTMELIKGLFDKSAETWSIDDVRKFKPTTIKSDDGEFSITVKFDDRRYKYFLVFDYKEGTVVIETLAPPKGRERGLRLPEVIRGIFSPEFVRRFIFDGEQVAKTMDSSSNEAEETIKYLYRLDKLDEIIALNQKVLEDVQNAEKEIGSERSLNILRTKLSKVLEAKNNLIKQRDDLHKEISSLEREKKEKINQRKRIDNKYTQLSQEKNDIEKRQSENGAAIGAKIDEIMSLAKFPYLLTPKICDRMQELGNSMTKLKLPKTISKDFFVDLADAPKCVCDRCIGAQEKQAILKNAQHYLGSDQQSILNIIKSSLVNSKFDSRLDEAFEQLGELQEQANILISRHINNEEKLVRAGGKRVEELQNQIDKLIEDIASKRTELQSIESKDESDEKFTYTNNIHKAILEAKEYEQNIAAATRTNNALNKKKIVESLVLNIRDQATKELKEEIIRKTNAKLKRVIKDDLIEIESIDQYIKLCGRDGASEGQTLGIAYCFLGTLFEDSELEFPFVIDSPTGKMDFEKRQAVADIIPALFNQLVAFVQSAEVDHFADQFYNKSDVQYLTIIASPQGEVVVHKGVEFFDSYQREHKGDEK